MSTHELIENTHSDDFSCVWWHGRYFTFNERQAEVLRILWENWERGTPLVRQAYVLAQAAENLEGLDGKRFSNVFRQYRKPHTALGWMIHVDSQGRVQLGTPAEKL